MKTLENELSTRIAQHKIRVLERFIYEYLMQENEKDTGVKFPFSIQQGIAWDTARKSVQEDVINLSIQEFNRRYEIAWQNLKEKYE